MSLEDGEIPSENVAATSHDDDKETSDNMMLLNGDANADMAESAANTTPNRTLKRKLKKAMRKIEKGRGTREDFYNTMGDAARADIELKLSAMFSSGNPHLRANHLQECLLWILGEGTCPKWIFVKNKPLVEKVVVVVVEGFTAEAFEQHKTRFHGCESIFERHKPDAPVPIQLAPSLFSSTSVLHSLLSCSRKKIKGHISEKAANRSTKRQKPNGTADAPPADRGSAAGMSGSSAGSATPQGDKDPWQYVLRLPELVANQYPIDHAWLSSSDAVSRSRPVAQGAAASPTPAESTHVSDGRKHAPLTDHDRDSRATSTESKVRTVSSSPSSPTSTDPSRAAAMDTDTASPAPAAATGSSSSVSNRSWSDIAQDYVTFARTKPRDPVAADHMETDSKSRGDRMIGVDCEMCLTEYGQELARLTLINEAHEVLYDQLVLPQAPITDYCTRWSGITKELMATVTTKFEEAQQAFLQHVHSDTILVGHSVENDLRALRVVHRHVIDTSVLYPHPRGPPLKSSLKFLANKYLKRHIQSGGGKTGHDSVEDAVAALQLSQLKIKKGPNFGLEKSDTESLFAILSRYRRSMDMVARPDLLKQFAGAAVGAISVLSDEAAIKAAFKLVHKTTDLVWIVLEEFKRAQDQLSTEVDHSSAARAARFVVMADAAQRLNDRLVRLFHECPDNTVFMVVSGDPSTTEYKALQQQLLKIPSDAIKAKLEARSQKLQQASQQGVFFITVRNSQIRTQTSDVE